MKKQHFFYSPFCLLILTSLLTLPACKKDPPEQNCSPGLPCATQTGENTFGCYIDGKSWVAEIAPYVFDPTVHDIEAQYDEADYGTNNNNFLYVKGGRYDSITNGFISLSIRPLISTGEIYSSQVSHLDASGLITYINNGQTVNAISFSLDTIFDYHIEITYLNMEKNIVAGIFSFTGTSAEDTVKVTDGRFDVKYDPY